MTEYLLMLMMMLMIASYKTATLQTVALALVYNESGKCNVITKV
jgi:hypothetical protein